eukprot:TRINITY_DN6659_c0_g1_i4.p1 TRINITY_DN6659_c0_g1~~TRINITY_DN6659_c0_g1_i4.p1  ORF type:complete len:377 (-),score=51.53 TRINITY_DN6659_c0_g1_i4:581-1711(-)
MSQLREAWLPHASPSVTLGRSGAGTSSAPAAANASRRIGVPLTAAALCASASQQQFELAAAAQSCNHEALLTLVAREVDLNQYVVMEWDLPPLPSGTIRTARAEFTALHLLAAHGAGSTDCVKTALRFGADPSLSVRGFSADAHKDSSDDSEEEQQHQAALKRLNAKSCRKKRFERPAQHTPWAVLPDTPVQALLPAELVGHNHRAPLSAADLQLRAMLMVTATPCCAASCLRCAAPCLRCAPPCLRVRAQVEQPAQPVSYPSQSMEQGFSGARYMHEHSSADLRRSELGPAPFRKGSSWADSWDATQGKPIGAETFEALPTKVYHDHDGNWGDSPIDQGEVGAGTRANVTRNSGRVVPGVEEGRKPGWNQFTRER